MNLIVHKFQKGSRTLQHVREPFKIRNNIKIYHLKEKDMQKKFMLILTALLLAISAACQAHIVADDNPKMQKKALAVINKVENFMKTNYNISLRNDVTVINTYDYAKTITEYKLQDIRYALEHSAAVSVPQRNLIILNMNIVTPEAYDFFLTHELVHKYQNLQAAFDGNNVNNHIGILEGIADDIAQKLTKITLSCKDQKIPFSEIASPKEFQNANIKYGDVKVYEQCRYYAKEYLKENKKLYYTK